MISMHIQVMLMNTLYIDVDNIILDICNIANEDQSMINNLHILEECGVSTNRYFEGVWGVNKQIFWRSVGCQQTDIQKMLIKLTNMVNDY